jgi:hypothetical protein
MFRSLLLTLVTMCAVFAANQRLYLKDGTYHLVREYKIQADRIRYYSVERGDWEEIPLDLADLKKTQNEVKQREEELKAETAANDAEEKAERAQRHEIERIPMEAGVFYMQGEKADVLKPAESKVVNNKGRSVLKAMSPIPIVSGKATVEIDGLHAPFAVHVDRPEFYIRLANEERFGIVRLEPTKKNARVLEKLEIIPVTKEIVEQPDLVEVFRQQLGDGLYKVWPTKPIAPGEYAVVEYTEGKANMQAWDFSYIPAK